MSTTIHNSNTACCSIPPVQSIYTPKGNYKAFGGLENAYIVGPDAEKAIVVVYDIFGYWPQTLQGADILSETLKVKVIMPDFFKGKPFDLSRFPPKTDEDKAELQKFFGTQGDFNVVVPQLKEVAAALRTEGAKKVGAIGFCWGAKATIKAGASDSFDAVAAVHPAMLSAADAEPLAVPLALFPSKDESLEEYEKLVKAISQKPFASKNAYKVYDNMHHGWAAARGNLEDEENKKQYADVYSRLAGFFEKALE